MAADAPRAELWLLWASTAGTALLLGLTGFYMLRQDGVLRELAILVVPVPPVLGAASCILAARRERRLWLPAGSFLAGLPFVLDAWTRSRFVRNEENCGAPGPLPFGWDGGVLDALLSVLWLLGPLLVVAGLALLAPRAWRPAGGRLALAGAAIVTTFAWVGVRCVGT